MTGATDERPVLVYVSTLDHILRPLLPHLKAARKAGFRVETACRITRFRADLEAHADACHDLPMRRFPLHPANLIALARLTGILRRVRPLIVHAHNPTGGFVGRLAATLARVPVRAYTAHGFHFHAEGRPLTNALFRIIETVAGWLLSDAVFVVNRDDLSAARRGVVPPGRVFLAGGGGIDTGYFSSDTVSEQERTRLRESLRIPLNAPVLSLVGEMIPRKRHGDALRALAALDDRFRNSVLLLAGEGVLEDDLKTQARELGIVERCRFLGFQRDVRPYLAISDLFLFPSQQEGLPFCVQEALAMEVPVVASDVRGNRDLITQGCGRLVPFGNITALADAVTELLLLPPEKRRAMGSAGRAAMRDERDESVCIRDWLAVYRTVLERKKLPIPPGLPTKKRTD